MENMINPPEISIGLNGSTCGLHEVTRYQIDFQMKRVQTKSFPSTSAHLEDGEELRRYYNKFDFPAINEAYRGSEVNSCSVILVIHINRFKIYFSVLYHVRMEQL